MGLLSLHVAKAVLLLD